MSQDPVSRIKQREAEANAQWAATEAVKQAQIDFPDARVVHVNGGTTHEGCFFQWHIDAGQATLVVHRRLEGDISVPHAVYAPGKWMSACAMPADADDPA